MEKVKKQENMSVASIYIWLVLQYAADPQSEDMPWQNVQLLTSEGNELEQKLILP